MPAPLLRIDQLDAVLVLQHVVVAQLGDLADAEHVYFFELINIKLTRRLPDLAVLRLDVGCGGIAVDEDGDAGVFGKGDEVVGGVLVDVFNI